MLSMCTQAYSYMHNVLVAYGWLFLRDLFSCHGQNVNFSDPLTFHLRYKSCGSFVTMQKEKLGHENNPLYVTLYRQLEN